MFNKRLPEAAQNYVITLFSNRNLKVALTRTRHSKLGDYKPPQLKSYHRISINADLSPHVFLIIAIHELAHMLVWEKYGKKVSPHGIEWKQTFKELMLPLLNDQVFPLEILPMLAKHFLNPKASVTAAPMLFHALKNIGFPHHQTIFLKDIADNSYFKINNNKIFQRMGIKKRRILCKQLQNGKLYLVNPLCEVIIVEENAIF